MPATTVDEYLAELPEPKRSTLEDVRRTLMALRPDLQETIGWGAPIFKLNGKNVAGLCAFKNHLVYSPQSAEVLIQLADQLADFTTAKSSLQFAIDKPLDEELVRALLEARIAELGL
ncbi:MAG: hypothetical protein RJA35_356 [Actinomycetota bacterium]|jgi:uncharacterized protein YdhG (YjbR/CyaY superfamily)